MLSRDKWKLRFQRIASKDLIWEDFMREKLLDVHSGEFRMRCDEVYGL